MGSGSSVSERRRYWHQQHQHKQLPGVLHTHAATVSPVQLSGAAEYLPGGHTHCPVTRLTISVLRQLLHT